MRFRALAAISTLLSGVSFAAEAPITDMDIIGAARRGDSHAVHKLLELDPASAEQVDDDGYTALHWAAIRAHWRIVEELVTAGAPVDAIGADGGTPLHWACHHDRPDMIALLLEAGADPEIANLWGRTPLHVASRRGCLGVAALLLDRGANPNALTREGWTPLHVAFRSGWPEVAELLLARGADPDRADDEGLRPADVAMTRPLEVSVEASRLDQYVGLYDLGEGCGLKIWRDGDRLGIREFAPDALYPIGEDEFFCRAEPWRVRFRRGADGSISGLELHFLRRTVTASRTSSPRYVGSAVCRSCHQAFEDGNPGISWLASRHSHAYWRLGSDWSLELAHLRPQYADVASPMTDDRCLLCHVTASQDDDALLGASFRIEEGVGCEACHGPGSDYASVEVMADRERFVAAGGRLPDAAACRSCHRNPEHFDFDEWWPEIAHRARRDTQDTPSSR